MPFWLMGYEPLMRWAMWAPIVMLMTTLVLLTLHVWEPQARPMTGKAFLFIGGGMLLVQPYLALSWSPPERYMGDVYRILYMHYPQIAMGMLGFTVNFVASIVFLFKKSWVADALGEAAAVVGVYFGAVGLALGSIWARPTWGAWWTDDPRLNSTAVMLATYVGYSVLRRFVEDPEKRATWSGVAGILAGANVPLVYFAVKARSIHQEQSNPSTVNDAMVMALRWSLTTFLCLFIGLLYQRYLHAQASRKKELAEPDLLPDAPVGGPS